MYKYLLIVVLISTLACNQPMTKDTVVSSWTFNAQNHSASLDHISQPLVFQYQELYKGIISKDTNYINLVVRNTIQLTDSLGNLKLALDSNLQKIWIDGLYNINAEFQGLLAANIYENPTEFYMSYNMCNIQLLNMLGQIGYKEHSIYIFNTNFSKSEDGFYWWGLQKNSKDPFKPEQHEQVAAIQILQETK
jgi:hypothetical protein